MLEEVYDLVNSYYRIKEILSHNRLDATVSKHTREAKEKNIQISKESNKFAKQLDLTPKEKEIKDKAKEAVKT